jgi:deazaflavin-dependent oxidoreductase (nitroreductase family)
MWRQFARGAGSLSIALIALWVLFTVAMRMKFRPVLDGLRRTNRRVFNPRTMKTAGRPGAYASVVRHVGRTTGTRYETPVVARPTDNGFAIVLPYGTRADWVRNVLAAGHAVIVNEGTTYRVDHPQVRPVAAADAHLAPNEQRNHRLYGIGDVLLVRRDDGESVRRPAG